MHCCFLSPVVAIVELDINIIFGKFDKEAVVNEFLSCTECVSLAAHCLHPERTACNPSNIHRFDLLFRSRKRKLRDNSSHGLTCFLNKFLAKGIYVSVALPSLFGS